MIDTSVYKVDFRVCIKCAHQVTEAFAWDFQDLLWIASLLLEDYIPEGIRTILWLRVVRARLAYIIDELNISKLQALRGYLFDLVHEVVDYVFLHAIDALYNDSINRDAGCLVHLARFPEQVNHALGQAWGLSKQAKHILSPLQNLLVIIFAREYDFEGFERVKIFNNIFLLFHRVIHVGQVAYLIGNELDAEDSLLEIFEF